MIDTENFSKPGVMFIAVHQDDAEALAGGLFAKMKGHLDVRGRVACFTDGSVGHYRAEYLKHPDKLIEMRDSEASNAASVFGFDYQRLVDDEGKLFKDARLEINWKTRGAVWKAIRDFQPDLIITLPVNDSTDPYGMHNDHTNGGEIVKRTAYLIPAPLAFSEYYPDGFTDGLGEDHQFAYVKPPIIITAHDPYSGQIQPDIVISLTKDELEQKVQAWGAHVSQWQQWLPWVGRYDAPTDTDSLRQSLIDRSNRLAKNLPVETTPGGVYESFTITKWALRVPTIDEIKKYFPDDILDYEFAEKKITELSQ
ncbi:PIG-L deacetylase family protein [Candidatus Poribacteria bacterium]